MVRDNVTFRFRVDSAKAEETFRRLEAMAKKFGGTVERTSGKVDNLKTNMGKLGQQSAASAVNFQTATQGMLNLSTAAVQTYTSISNLARANNRAEMSVIAVARAKDLLNNKTQRLNEMTQQGITSGGKYANMQREIATATADLAVKTDKMAIEQDAVNDIYMLFATNIANVTISSMQTIAVLLGHERSARLANIAVMKIQKLLHIDTARAQYTETSSRIALSAAMRGGTATTIGLTAAVGGLTAATKALMVANAPLLAITAVMTAAWILYENNIGNVKDKIDSLMGVQKSHLEIMEEERLATSLLEESNNDLANSFGFTIPKSLGIATVELAKFRGELEQLKTVTDKVKIPTGGPFTVGQLIQQRNSQDFRDARKGGSFFGIEFPEFLPSAEASEFVEQSSSKLLVPQFAVQGNTPIELREYAIEFLEEYVKNPEFREQVFKQQETEKSLKYSSSLTAQRDAIDAIQDLSNPIVREKIEAEEAGLSLKEYQLRKVFRTSIPNVLSAANPLTGDPGGIRHGVTLFKGRGIEALEGKIVGGKAIGDKLRLKLFTVDLLKRLKRPSEIDDPTDELTGTQYLRELSRQKGTQSFTLTQAENRILEKANRGEISGNRAAVILELGIDVGNAANNYTPEEAMRIGALQKLSNDMNGMSGGFADAFKGTLSEQGQAFRNMAGLNNASAMTGGLIGGKTNFGTGFFKSTGATAAYQVPRGSIATPKHIMTAIRNQDSFANGIGRYLENLTALLTGKKQKLQYRNSFNHKTQTFIGESRESLNNALDFGFRSNQDFVEKLNQSLVDIDPQSEGAVARARQNVKTSVSIAQEFLKMQFALLRGVGIESTTVSAIAGEIGFNGELPAGFLNNLQVLSQMNRSDFNNYDIIHESKNKLNMSNQEVFAIRFDAKRGDDELLDRLRFEDRLEAMSSGTSAF
uniref:Tail tape measure protein n=1 Tax=Yangshan Harbor Nitrososphaeria virus TaxID=2969597 RepID=A0A976UB34_9CAUD|nr:tail tape measure protein [Yangshan Harbor Nitrososphaeria virus]